MCTFLSTLPKKSKTQGTAKKRNLVLSLRECPVDEDGQQTWYRVRLLNFSSRTTARDYPFIPRYVHQKWGKNDKGLSELQDEVICPVTKHVDWEGDRYDCPICKYANQQFGALKASNWKDADARKKNKEFGRKFQGIIPVYVVNDPVYEGNNGKFKVIILNDKKVYDDFVKRVEKQLLKANCFNGVNAVNCCIHVSIVEQVNNEGQPNEYRWKQKVIDKIAFERPEKASDIAAITKEAVDAFPFDDEYYTSSTIDELKAFYNKHIKVHASNDDIDISDDAAVEQLKPDAIKPSTSAPIASLENAALVKKTEDVSADDLDELAVDAAETISKPTVSADADVELDDKQINDLLAGVDI